MWRRSSGREAGVLHTRIGLIGLGNAGRALATALAGTFDIVAYDRDASRLKAAAETGCQAVDSVCKVAARCPIVLLSLPTPESSRSVSRELAETGLDDHLIIETSTVAPSDIQWLVDFFAPKGAAVMDAAIVGGVQRLAAGRTTFLVGADAGSFARARPILEQAAEDIFHLGEAGSGMRAKLVNNAIAHTTMVMLIEGAALARKTGLPLHVFQTLMERESGLMRPLTHRFGERIKNQDFKGGMPTDNARKDSALVLNLARELGVPLFTLQASHAAYDIATAQGLGQMDYAAISKLWEQWLDISLGFADEK